MATTSSTHQLIEAKEVKDGIVVLKNGGLRAVLMVSSINFALKSSEEQEGIINRFQDFINSVDFPIQILVQSRKLDISEYLKFLNERIGVQTNELLKIQTSEYLSFIQELVKLTNVMSKFFYVIIPLGTVTILENGFFSKFFSKNKTSAQDQKDLNFENQKNNLQQRINQVTSLLGSMGLKAIPLEKESLVELLYTSYNPGAEVKQKNLEALIATGDEAKKSE